MISKITLRIWLTATLLSVTCTTTLAQDSLVLTPKRTLTPTIQSPVTAAGITQPTTGYVLTNVLGTAAAADSNGCVCTNLQQVSVICEDCDKESDAGLCFTHDRACQDAAQQGGIREHNTFFCTTPID